MRQQSTGTPVRRAFISYSRGDRELARLLDATLQVAGVETFRDEHGISVGDSIPEWVYESLAAATHLIYLISANSVDSKWVKEELDIAKMREKEDAGFRILPVLMDDVLLPTGVSHLKYADFKQWKDPSSYRSATLDLLNGLGLKPHLVADTDVMWWIEHRDRLMPVLITIAAAHGVLEAGIGWVQFYDSMTWVARELEEPGTFEEALASLIELCTSSSASGLESPRIGQMAERANEIREIPSTLRHTQALDPEGINKQHQAAVEYRDEVASLLGMLAQFDGEAASVTFAAIGH